MKNPQPETIPYISPILRPFFTPYLFSSFLCCNEKKYKGIIAIKPNIETKNQVLIFTPTISLLNSISRNKFAPQKYLPVLKFQVIIEQIFTLTQRVIQKNFTLKLSCDKFLSFCEKPKVLFCQFVCFYRIFCGITVSSLN